jgi:hypothetical protein
VRLGPFRALLASWSPGRRAPTEPGACTSSSTAAGAPAGTAPGGSAARASSASSGPSAPPATRGLTRTQAERELRRLVDATTVVAKGQRPTVGEAGDAYVAHLDNVMERKRTTMPTTAATCGATLRRSSAIGPWTASNPDRSSATCTQSAATAYRPIETSLSVAWSAAAISSASDASASRALPWTLSSVRLKTTFGIAHQTSANSAPSSAPQVTGPAPTPPGEPPYAGGAPARGSPYATVSALDD